MDATDPLFLMYTSGTTGKPKGCQHSTGGYLAYVTGTSKYYQDIHPEDVYWCMADIGWITGHSLHRLRPAGAGRHERPVRRRADLSGRGAPVANRRAIRRQHLPHLADRDPHAAEDGPRRAEEVQLPLQAHDDGRRADRARGVALVLRGRRQGRSGHRRHVVADRDRRIPHHDQAGARSDEAGQRRSARPRHLPGHLRRRRQGSSGRISQGGEPLHPQSVARHHADDLGRSATGSSGSTTRSTAGTRTARTGATGRTSPATAASWPRTATSGSSAGSTMSSTSPAIGWARRSSSRRA